MSITKVAVKDIKAGDKLTYTNGDVAWTALEDARLIPAEELSDYGPEWATVMVRYRDGAEGSRTWDDPDIELPVVR